MNIGVAYVKDGRIKYIPEKVEAVIIRREAAEIAVKSYLAIDRVRELHKPSETLGIWDVVCSVCMEGDDPADYVEYPCDTIRALDGEQE